MSQLEYDYDEVLRRALHTAADLVEPAGDGLERIRARLTVPRPLPLGRLMARCSGPAFSRMQPFTAWLQSALGPVIERLRPAPDARHPRRPLPMLHPAVAMAAAVVVVVMGAFTLTALPQAISDSSGFLSLPFVGGPGGQQGHPGVTGHGSRYRSGAATPSSASGQQSGRRSDRDNCPTSKPAHPGPAASPSPSQSPTQSPSPSPSASPSPSPSPTVSASPSPTVSATPDPGSAVSSSPTPKSDVADVSSDGPASAADFPTSSPRPKAGKSQSPRPCASRQATDDSTAKRLPAGSRRPAVSQLSATAEGADGKLG